MVLSFRHTLAKPLPGSPEKERRLGGVRQEVLSDWYADLH
jgi:hypothetical protein